MIEADKKADGKVFESPPSKSSTASESGSAPEVRRESGGLRAALTPDRIALSAGAVPSEQEAGSEIAALEFSAKAFIGPNATYYDDRWRWMGWRGRRRSWNWAAAASVGAWLAYRRMHRYATIYGLWLLLLLVLALSGTPLRLVGLLQLGVAVGLGLYGNTLYQQHFFQSVREVGRRHSDHAERVGALVAAGGVDRRALCGWATVVLAAGALLLSLASSLGLEARWRY